MVDAVDSIIGTEFGDHEGHCWRCAVAVTTALIGRQVLPERFDLAARRRDALAVPVADGDPLRCADVLTMPGRDGRTHVAVVVSEGPDPWAIDTDSTGRAARVRVSALRDAYGDVRAARLKCSAVSKGALC